MRTGIVLAFPTLAMIASGSSTAGQAHEAACADALRVLHERGIQFLVGGTFAFTQYTGVVRATKDLDLFVAPDDLARTLRSLTDAGFATHVPFPHWLAKARREDLAMDLIFSSGNGVARVDGDWFRYAADVTLYGIPVKLSPIEELIWSKSFVMERERFDGADVLHLLRARGHVIDWPRLIARYGEYRLVLAAHLLLFRFAYSDAEALLPPWVVAEVLSDLSRPGSGGERTCFGTLLSREQYLADVSQLGYLDARLARGHMQADALEIWTRAIDEDHHEQ
ncbi:nucleotidyltransferase [Luteitalea sp. TBR-22]|uniref:nucleotidyltransferase n=1 Tax=Luteitalea sp. TBR-22 TaxID=2802971 RepID=UPI001EF735BD|nr:nucleotidyltransferase [Luteitalea sp. TBR-22]